MEGTLTEALLVLMGSMTSQAISALKKSAVLCVLFTHHPSQKGFDQEDLV